MPNKNGGIISCEICGHQFYRSQFFITTRPQRFCSKKCLGKYQSGERAPRWKEDAQLYRCAYCNKEFRGLSQRQKNKNNFCSALCYHSWCSGENNYAWRGGGPRGHCDYCEKEFVVTRQRLKARKNIFCSRECFKAWFQGKNNHQHGKTGELSPAYVNGHGKYYPYPPEFNNQLKENIRERDDHQCQFCGTTQNGRKFPIHHIDYNIDNNHPSNLITLCDADNVKANHSRDKWQQFFETYQEIRLIHPQESPHV